MPSETIDLLDGELYVNDPYPLFALLRDSSAVVWDATNELWGVLRYDDIVEIERRKDVFINSDQVKGGYRPAAMEFAQAASDLYAHKERCPADDIMSIWTTATVDGEPLGVDAVTSDCLLLLDGGAETTRTVIARGMLHLIEHPDQWQLLRGGADLAVATEELIRYTPIHNMCRVAIADTEVGGQRVEAGQQLVLMYGSANRDPAHFDDPERFDVTRQPNNHLAFGFGTHFCLGTALARMEIRLFLEELVRRVRAMRLVPGTAPVEMPNAFVHGLRSAHVELDMA